MPSLVGSEMCIRDSSASLEGVPCDFPPQTWQGGLLSSLLLPPHFPFQLSPQDAGTPLLVACRAVCPPFPSSCTAARLPMRQIHGDGCLHYVERHIYRRSHSLVVFLDIRCAFDSITPTQIHRSLSRVGADPGVIGWYNDYLLHRNMTYHHICLLYTSPSPRD